MSNYTRTDVDPTDIKPGDKVEYFDIMQVVESVTELDAEVRVRYMSGDTSHFLKSISVSVYHGSGPTWREKIDEQDAAVGAAEALLADLQAAAPDDLDTEYTN